MHDLVPIVELIHETTGTEYPVLLIGAGLPTSKAHLHRVKTYSERWRYFRLELLGSEDASNAITIPLSAHHVEIENAALEALAAETYGYPFFVQKYGSAAWTTAADRRITAKSIREIIPGVRKLVDSSLYEIAFETLTQNELRYALALARLGSGPHRIRNVAIALEEKVERVNWIRNQLIKKEIVYVPASGLVEFRLPLSDKFLLRNEREFARRLA